MDGPKLAALIQCKNFDNSIRESLLKTTKNLVNELTIPLRFVSMREWVRVMIDRRF